MQKERAAAALRHGLPVPTPLPMRARSRDASSSRPPGNTSAAPYSRASGTPDVRRMPLAVKLLGFGLLLLGAIYGLALLRDHRALEPERASVPDKHKPAVQPNTAAALLPEPARAPLK